VKRTRAQLLFAELNKKLFYIYLVHDFPGKSSEALVKLDVRASSVVAPVMVLLRRKG